MDLNTVIKKPIITEKSHRLVAEKNAYTLAVAEGANKMAVKEAVEKLFGVKVLGVKTLRKPIKLRRSGKWRKQTKISGYKKAIVSLKEGDKIPLFDLKGEKK